MLDATSARSTANPDIALVLCPTFTLGTPPLAVASLQAVLREAGFKTSAYDLDFALMRFDADTFRSFYAVYNIGHADDVQHVQFVVRPQLTLMSYFPEHYTETQRAPLLADLQVIGRMEEFLVKWAGIIANTGIRLAMFSVYVSNLLPSLLLARALKQVDPDIKVAFGGPGVGLAETQHFVLRFGCVDCCATGEGEVIAPQLARRLLDDSSLADVPGAAYLAQDRFVRNVAPPLMQLEKLRIPDFEGLPLPGHHVTHYRSNPNLTSRWYGVALPIASTRGCVKRCTFCAEQSYWQRYRLRKVDAVVNEIAELKARWGVRLFQFCDSLLNGSPRWIEEFCDKVVPLEVEFAWAYFRPTKLPRTLLEKIARAGFRILYFGMETASQELIDKAEKGTDVAEIRQVVFDTIAVGLHADITVLCGFPGESLEKFMESVRFCRELTEQIERELGADALSRLSIDAGSIIRVEPYARMFTAPEEYGITLEPFDPPLPKELAAFTEAISQISIRWTSDLSVQEKFLRSDLLQKLVYRASAINFREETKDFALDDETVLKPVDRHARILRDDNGKYYLISKDRVRAELTPMAAQLWDLCTSGLSLGEIKRHLLAKGWRDGSTLPVARLYEQYLAAGLVYVEDFDKGAGIEAIYDSGALGLSHKGEAVHGR